VVSYVGVATICPVCQNCVVWRPEACLGLMWTSESVSRRSPSVFQRPVVWQPGTNLR
jgi:hypothetical protein